MKKNILTCEPGTILTGREIKDWVLHHVSNKTECSLRAWNMANYLTSLDDNSEYMVTSSGYQSPFCIQNLK